MICTSLLFHGMLSGCVPQAPCLDWRPHSPMVSGGCWCPWLHPSEMQRQEWGCLSQSSPNTLRRYESPASLPPFRTTLNSHSSSRTTCRTSWGHGLTTSQPSFSLCPIQLSTPPGRCWSRRHWAVSPPHTRAFPGGPGPRQVLPWPLLILWDDLTPRGITHLAPAQWAPRWFLKLHRNVLIWLLTYFALISSLLGSKGSTLKLPPSPLAPKLQLHISVCGLSFQLALTQCPHPVLGGDFCSQP